MSRLLPKLLLLLLVLLVALPALAGEGRTPLYQWANTITAPGKYIVTRDIFPTVCATPPIDIQASNVDIDLNGFRVFACPGKPVIEALGFDNITIRNGTIGFGDYGVFMKGGPNGNRKVVIEDVKVLDVLVTGIHLEDMTDFALRRNNVTTTDFFALPQNQRGIWIQGNVLIVTGTLEDNQVERTGGGITVRRGSSVTILKNRLENIITQIGDFGALVYDVSEGGLISENTVQEVFDGSGIVLGDTHGCKVYNNVVRRAEQNGILLAGFSEDNLVLNNVVTQSVFDGVRVEGNRNHVDRNVINSNCLSGGQCWGLHFSLAVGGGNDNVFGRNMARGNFGAPAACPWGPGPYPPTPDFCDESAGNTSFNDNYMPNFF